MITLNQIQTDLRCHSDKEKAIGSMKFFKTKNGEYGAGDVFLGVSVPQTRKIISKYSNDSMLADSKILLESIYHEDRLAGVLLLVDFAKKQKYPISELAQFYLNNSNRINNWDLVDASSEYIVGPYLQTLKLKDKNDLIKSCIDSPNLWLNRIIVLASFYDIKNKDSKLTLYLAKKFLNHPHDLMHKAVGWMLREVGKRVSEVELLNFLDQFATIMPRVMLRYSIESLPADKKHHYLHLK